MHRIASRAETAIMLLLAVFAPPSGAQEAADPIQEIDALTQQWTNLEHQKDVLRAEWRTQEPVLEQQLALLDARDHGVEHAARGDRPATRRGRAAAARDARGANAARGGVRSARSKPRAGVARSALAAARPAAAVGGSLGRRAGPPRQSSRDRHRALPEAPRAARPARRLRRQSHSERGRHDARRRQRARREAGVSRLVARLVRHGRSALCRGRHAGARRLGVDAGRPTRHPSRRSSAFSSSASIPISCRSRSSSTSRWAEAD